MAQGYQSPYGMEYKDPYPGATEEERKAKALQSALQTGPAPAARSPESFVLPGLMQAQSAAPTAPLAPAPAPGPAGGPAATTGGDNAAERFGMQYVGNKNMGGNYRSAYMQAAEDAMLNGKPAPSQEEFRKMWEAR